MEGYKEEEKPKEKSKGMVQPDDSSWVFWGTSRERITRSPSHLVGEDHFQVCLLLISHSFPPVCSSSLFLLILGCCLLIGSRN